ncbi:uncharacterized protein [Panulirus ornatus]|uniref:uncharacterized protein n=1 Tax=Panulirus ornatus TaxID=150431 RepID=UPI003A87471D
MPLLVADTEIMRENHASVLVVLVMWVMAGAWNNATPLRYVTSVGLGNFLMAQEKALARGEKTLANLTLSSYCQCRMACWSHLGCRAVSMVWRDKEVECRLSQFGPLESQVLSKSSATYIFWQDSVRGIMYEEVRRRMYLVPNEEMSFQEGKALCMKIPDHHLAIAKSQEEFKALLDVQARTGISAFWVDLHTGLNGPLWGDGTQLRDTPLWVNYTTIVAVNLKGDLIYRFRMGTFDNTPLEETLHPICQSKYLGRDSSTSKRSFLG